MKRIIAATALAAFSFAGVQVITPVAAQAAPCAWSSAAWCTQRNADNPMAPYGGKKGPRSAKSSPRSAGNPSS